MTTATQTILGVDAFPVNSGKTNFSELRQALTGLIQSTGTLTEATSPSNPLLYARDTTTMGLNIRAFTCAFMRDSLLALVGVPAWGVALGANPSTATIVLPAAQSLPVLYTIYAKANDLAKGEDGNSVIDYIASDPAASPTYVYPPEGGFQLGTVLIPAGATSLSSSGVVITNQAKRAIVRGVDLVANNASHRDWMLSQNQSGMFDYANTNHQRLLQDSGIRVMRLDYGVIERYRASFDASSNPSGVNTGAPGWYPVPGETVRATATRASTASIDSATTRTAVTLTTINSAFTRGSGGFAIYNNGLQVPYSGEWEIRVRLQWPANSNGYRLLSLLRNGSSEPNGIVDSRPGTAGISTYVTIFETLLLQAGDYIQAGVAQNSGATLLLPNPAVELTAWYKSI